MSELERRQRLGERQTLKKWPNEVLLRKLRAVAELTGRTPGVKIFKQMAGSGPQQTLVDRYGSWRNACIAAGLDPHPRPPQKKFGAPRYTEDELLASYIRIRDELGRIPTYEQWNATRIKGEITADGIRKRYHRWTAFLTLMEDVLSDSEPPESEDDPYLTQDPPVPVEEPSESHRGI